MAEPDTLRNALVHTALGRWLEAVAAWRGAFEQVPYTASLVLADAALRCGQLELAQHCIASSDAFVPGTAYIARLKERADTIAQRRQTFEDLAEPAEVHLDTLRKSARAASECHLWERAIELWIVFVDRGGPNAEAMKRLAAAFQSIGDYANAAVYYREANRLKPDADMAEALERVQRLDQRRFDAMGKHMQRFLQLPGVQTAQSAAASIADIGVELELLERAARGSPAAVVATPERKGDQETVRNADANPVQSESARETPLLREVDLSALRQRARGDQPTGHAGPSDTSPDAGERPAASLLERLKALRAPGS